MRLEGKIALVTGAGSGLGRALAIALSHAGGTVILIGRRADRLEETRSRLSWPGRAVVLAADITSARDRARIADAVARHGRLDLLFNNAGVVCADAFTRTGDAAMERMLATNVLAPFALTRDLVPYLRKGEAPRIANIGSMFGDIAFPRFAGYSATKFALRGLSDGMRRELAPLGIGVTYAAPRAVDTEAVENFRDLVAPLGMKLDDPADVARQILRGVARGRRSVYPRGVERLFVLIARLVPAAVDRSITGQFRRLRPAG